jgi:hypothetical protein
VGLADRSAPRTTYMAKVEDREARMAGTSGKSWQQIETSGATVTVTEASDAEKAVSTIVPAFSADLAAKEGRDEPCDRRC